MVKENDRWTVAVDGVPAIETFDMAWDPVFSPSGDHTLARVRRDGRYALLVDGRKTGAAYDRVWDPVFSPDGNRVLLKYMVDGTIYRHVAAMNELV